ncbi:hypothetical protein VKT23_016672 [Stygiomarasmius scandens]|uniref:Uncharacterized protein n=1 Tax=Marasmiellus scandens TaxID=2682957 RepID=A0ABR1IUB4_9AGAR
MAQACFGWKYPNRVLFLTEFGVWSFPPPYYLHAHHENEIATIKNRIAHQNHSEGSKTGDPLRNITPPPPPPHATPIARPSPTPLSRVQDSRSRHVSQAAGQPPSPSRPPPPVAEDPTATPTPAVARPAADLRAPRVPDTLSAPAITLPSRPAPTTAAAETAAGRTSAVPPLPPQPRVEASPPAIIPPTSALSPTLPCGPPPPTTPGALFPVQNS